jgi:hypothetical protein
VSACELCAAKVDDAAVCSGCLRRAELALGDTPALIGDLETVLAKLTKYADEAQRVSGSRGADLPWNLRAGVARQHLHAVLTSWVGIVAAERYGDWPEPRPLPVDRSAACAGWLLGRPAHGEQTEIEWIRHQRWAAEAIDNLTGAVRAIGTLLDAPATRATIHVGPCPEHGCPGQVEAFIPRDPDTMAHAGCSADVSHVWEPSMWNRLGKRMLRVAS